MLGSSKGSGAQASGGERLEAGGEEGEAAAELGLPLISGYAGVHFAGQRSGRCLADVR